LDRAAPAVEGLPPAAADRARVIAEALAKAERPLVVSGYGCGDAAVVQAAAALTQALAARGRKPRLYLSLPECNSLGLALLRAPPLEQGLSRLQEGSADALLVLENDLFRRLPPKNLERTLARTALLTVLDHTFHRTAQRADLVLPAASFAEDDGTLVSAEGRAQRYYKTLAPEAPLRSSWRWLQTLHEAVGRGGSRHRTLASVTSECAAAFPVLRRIGEAAAGAGTATRIARATPRFSGRTAAQADWHIHEPPAPADPDSPLVFSMEGNAGPEMAPYQWAPGWSSDESLHLFQHGTPPRAVDTGTGVRLLEPAPPRAPGTYPPVPAAFGRRPGHWLLLPLQEVFGSEELSALSPPVAARAPGPYLVLGIEYARPLGLDADRPAPLEVALEASGARLAPIRLFPRLDPQWPPGTAGLPVGLPGLEGVELPAWGLIRRIDQGGKQR
jgi:NADH-quinone oxidoreductase subunit G